MHQAQGEVGALPASPGGADDPRLDDLAQIVEAYSAVTERLQSSHERLQDEVVRLRRELNSANAQVQRSRRLSALGEMAAGIAHEIRNPLAAIQLYAGMAAEDLEVEGPSAKDEALGNVRKIASAVRGMSAIVNDVLSFSRGTEPERVRVDASEILDRVIAANAPGIDQARVDVVRKDLGRGPLDVFADPGLLQQALLNLVRNAVDAMAGADGSRVLTLGVERDEVGVLLSVSDTGPGVSEDCLDRIFNPFFTTRSTGTGLGLAIVHRIADAHGGSIAVHREPMRGGAVFVLSLPDKCEQADAGMADPIAQEAL
ncbi:MAG: HAMP domain-containing histidine kinase [Phycisphaeraceae bacterium]|nr:HAMP domain-containing histidine kinase [Phycisphaeraceae bacterium]